MESEPELPPDGPEALAREMRVEPLELELAFDLGELTAPGASAPVCELELELKSGPLAPMTALLGEIMQEYGLRELKKSKYARARALTGAK